MRVFVEGAVIVASILLAFGIDAWWDGRQEREELRAMLGAVATDMRANIVDLDSAVVLHSDVRDAAAELFTLVASDPASVDPPRFDTLLIGTLDYWTYDPRTGAIDAVLTSGRLGRVSNEALRSTLTSWPETLRDFREDEERGASDVDTQLKPRVSSLVPIGVYQDAGVFRDAAQWNASGHDRLTPRAIRSVLADLQIANQIGDRIGRQDIIIGEAAELRTLMERMVSLIEEVLGGDEGG